MGRIAAHERVVGLTDFSQLGTLPPDCWLMLNFEAIKESPPTPADPRGKGEALWPARHSRALLDARRFSKATTAGAGLPGTCNAKPRRYMLSGSTNQVTRNPAF